MRRLAIVGVTDEVVQLLALLKKSPDLEVAAIYDVDPEGALSRLTAMPMGLRASLEALLTGDPERIDALEELFALVDAGTGVPLAEHFPDLARRGVQVITPLTARLLFGYEEPDAEPTRPAQPPTRAPDRKSELLQALREIVESVDLTEDTDELCARVLEVAVSVTGADGGSLMLLDRDGESLQVRAALGLERELWPKIRVRLGEGIAGRAAAEGRPITVSGRASQEEFQLLRERVDVQSALCVPLLFRGEAIGVLNLHHSTRPDAFGEADLDFAEQLGHIDAEIIARAQQHETLSRRAARYEAVREVRDALSNHAPLLERLGDLCRRVAERAGNGIATVYLYDADESELRLAATSLAGGGFAGEYRILPGQGVDGRVAEERRAAMLRSAEGRLSYAALPLLAGEQLLGVLSVQVGEHKDATREPDGRSLEETLLEIAAAVADEVADAERETRMAARASQMNAINETGIQLISCDDLGDAVRLATSSAALILAGEHALLRLQDETTRRYVIRSYYGGGDGSFQERLFRLDKRITVDLLRRRTPLLIRDLGAEPDYQALAPNVRSLLAAPLRQGDRVFGTLCVYDKVAADRFYPGAFNQEDLRVFTKYASYAERGLAHTSFQARTRQHRNFDDETGLPNENYLHQRLDQEVARAGRTQSSVAVMVCRIENLAAIRSKVDSIRAERVLLRTADSLRTHLREFDVLARISESDFAALLPAPGTEPDEHVYQLSRAVADEVCKDPALNETLRVGLAFGYAVYPREADDAKELIEVASRPRIRML
jgi:diguanylate cyclase (GGDEF)-like protein